MPVCQSSYSKCQVQVPLLLLLLLISYPYDQVEASTEKRLPRAKNILTQAERYEFLNAHNRWRSKVYPKAIYMKKMYWSSEVEETAQAWSNRCKRGHGHPDLSSKMYRSLGQNIYRGGFNVTAIVELWCNEVNDYDYTSNWCSKVCGHYTQVVWANTYVMGCGVKYCSGLGYNVVCDYYPPGNYRGQKPYKEGVSCSSCPSDASRCSNNLCEGIHCSYVETKCEVIDQDSCMCNETSYKGGLEPLVHSVWLVLLCLFLAVQR